MLALIVLALVAAKTDFQQRIIPNELPGAIALIGIALQIVRLLEHYVPHLLSLFMRLPLTFQLSQSLPSPLSCLCVAACALFFGVALEFAVRKISGNAGMGFGDIKYIAAWACVLGWFVLPALSLACLMGAVYAWIQHAKTFPLAPWLSMAFIATMLVLLFYPAAQPLVA